MNSQFLRSLAVLSVFSTGVYAQEIELPPEATPALGETLGSARVLDFDGDGDLDLLPAPYPVEGLSQSYFENDGTGALVARTHDFPSAPRSGSFLNEPYAALDDLDGDGNLDVIAAWLEPGEEADQPRLLGFQTLWGQPSGSFAAGPVHTGEIAGAFDANHREQVRLGAHDLDGDGRVELLNRAGIWTSDSKGQWHAAKTWKANRLPQVVIDLDGDQLPEIVALEVAPEFPAYVTGVSIGRAQGELEFAWETVHDFQPPVGRWHAQCSVADLDNDGDVDLAIASCNLEQIELALLENFDGGLVLAGITAPMPQPEVGRLIPADYDGDGDIDLLATPRYRASGAQLFLQMEEFNFIATSAFNAVTDGATADFDGDGFPEHASVSGTWRLAGNRGGIRQQYGWGSPGAWNTTPTLGWSGTGSDAQLVLGRALGGAPGWLLISSAEEWVPNAFGAGLHQWVAPGAMLQAFTCEGPWGAAAQGWAHFDQPPTGGVAVQALLLDPSTPSGLALTAGVRFDER